MRVVGLRMALGIAADLDVEAAVVLAADEFDQVGGVAAIAGVAHARGQVAAQRDDAAAADLLVTLQQRRQFRAAAAHARHVRRGVQPRSEEHTSELQSLMRTSYAVFCLKKKTKNTITHNRS